MQHPICMNYFIACNGKIWHHIVDHYCRSMVLEAITLIWATKVPPSCWKVSIFCKHLWRFIVNILFKKICCERWKKLSFKKLLKIKKIKHEPRVVAMVQWIDLRLPSCGPRFESRPVNLFYARHFWECIWFQQLNSVVKCAICC